MRNFQQKNAWSNISRSKPVLILLGLLLLFFAWNVLNLWKKMEDTAQNKKLVQNQLTSLEQQKQKLSTDINNLQTDEGKETIFRENYGLAKDGEDEIVVEEDPNQPAPAPQSSGGFFGFLKNLFK